MITMLKKLEFKKNYIFMLGSLMPFIVNGIIVNKTKYGIEK